MVVRERSPTHAGHRRLSCRGPRPQRGPQAHLRVASIAIAVRLRRLCRPARHPLAMATLLRPLQPPAIRPRRSTPPTAGTPPPAPSPLFDGPRDWAATIADAQIDCTAKGLLPNTGAPAGIAGGAPVTQRSTTTEGYCGLLCAPGNPARPTRAPTSVPGQDMMRATAPNTTPTVPPARPRTPNVPFAQVRWPAVPSPVPRTDTSKNPPLTHRPTRAVPCSSPHARTLRNGPNTPTTSPPARRGSPERGDPRPQRAPPRDGCD